MKRFRLIAAAFALFVSGCGILEPSPPSDAELARGLVIMYPGALNSTFEMLGFYAGMRAAGVQQAIEIKPWAPPLLNFVIPKDFVEYERPWAREEARRIAQYQRDYPGRPVTLLGYSGGAMVCILVAEELPAGHAIDRVIMMSPGVSTTYDLEPMLANTSGSAFVYWSPLDTVVNFATSLLGTLDGFFGPSAATLGFANDNPKLQQFQFGPQFAVFGNEGEHTDYAFSIEWISRFVAPWIAHD